MGKKRTSDAETFGERKKRLGAQGVSLRTETRIVDNLIKRARARGEKITRREALRRFRTSQEITISGKAKTKGGGKGAKFVSRKTGKRIRGSVSKTPKSATPREAILKTRPRTKHA